MKQVIAILVLATAALAQNQTGTQQLSITVSSAVAISTTKLNAGVMGAGYSFPLSASGGVAPYTWTAANLPAGLAVSGSSISGTLTDNGCTSSTPQSVNVSLSVKDSTGAGTSAAAPMSLICKLKIATTTLPGATVGVPYSANLASTGGSGPLLWLISSGTLCPGLSLSGSTIQGTPSVSGNCSFTASVSDQTSQVAQWKVNLQWQPSPSVTSGYNLYRGTTSGGPYVKVSSTSGTIFMDTAPSRASSYFYVATAVNGTAESQKSNEAKVVIP